MFPKRRYLIGAFLGVFGGVMISCQRSPSARETLKNVIEAHGGAPAFYRLRDVAFDVEVETQSKHAAITPRGQRPSYAQWLRFRDEACGTNTHCAREMFLFALPFKLAHPRYTVSFADHAKGERVAPQNEKHLPGRRLKLCFDDTCVRIAIDASHHITELEAFDPVLGHDARIGYTWTQMHGLWLPQTRTYRRQSDHGVWQVVRTEKLSNIRFWNGY